MPRRTDGPLCKSNLCTLIFLRAVACLLLTNSHGVASQQVGQPAPLTALTGHDVTLPCHRSPAVDATDDMLEWSRPDLSPRFVHVRRSGEDHLTGQNPSYKRRTSVAPDGLKQGDVSLKLSRVRLSDEGTYRCFIPGSETDSRVQLVVDVFIQITKVRSGVLQCESAGWYPEPEVLWLDGEGNLLPAGPPETLRGPDGLYTVSSRVTVEKHSSSFTCRVQQKDINQTREAHIQVPEDFFASSKNSVVAAIIGLLVGFIFILAVVFIVWKWRQNKSAKFVRAGGETASGRSNESEQEGLMGNQGGTESLSKVEGEDENKHLDKQSKQATNQISEHEHAQGAKDGGGHQQGRTEEQVEAGAGEEEGEPQTAAEEPTGAPSSEGPDLQGEDNAERLSEATRPREENLGTERTEPAAKEGGGQQVHTGGRTTNRVDTTEEETESENKGAMAADPAGGMSVDQRDVKPEAKPDTSADHAKDNIHKNVENKSEEINTGTELQGGGGAGGHQQEQATAHPDEETSDAQAATERNNQTDQIQTQAERPVTADNGQTGGQTTNTNVDTGGQTTGSGSEGTPETQTVQQAANTNVNGTEAKQETNSETSADEAEENRSCPQRKGQGQQEEAGGGRPEDKKDNGGGGKTGADANSDPTMTSEEVERNKSAGQGGGTENESDLHPAGEENEGRDAKSHNHQDKK